MEKLAKFLGTSFGVGFIPGAQGTYGALVALPIIWSFHHFSSSWNQYNYILISSILISYFVGVWACGKVVPSWGHDPSKIVIDETCGMFITMLAIDFNFINLITGFILFRVFDILKPFGIRKIDQITSTNHTVMLDDVLAGIYANVVLQVFIKLLSFAS